VTQLEHRVRPFSPFWRRQFGASGIGVQAVRGVVDLPRVPAVGERDLCPDGDPAGAAALVLQGDEQGFARHARGGDLRSVLLSRLTDPRVYRQRVAVALKPTTYTFGGLALRYPVASTRADLEVVARLGARAWATLGLGDTDVLLSAVPTGSELGHAFLAAAAQASGVAALFPGDDPAEVARLSRQVAATVLAVPAAAPDRMVRSLLEQRAALGSVTTVLVVGTREAPEPTATQREVAALLGRPVDVRLLWGPPDGRWMYAQDGDVLVTYPDTEVLEVVDPETGEPATPGAGGELVLTQLDVAGSALLRWRTGALLPTGLRRLPRSGGRPSVGIPLPLRAGALVPGLRLPRDGGPRGVDLRAVAAALAGRDDLVDWQVRVTRGRGLDQLLVWIAPKDRAAAERTATSVAGGVRAASGVLPTQLVVVEPAALRVPPPGALLSPRIVDLRPPAGAGAAPAA
jgi:hypothetical protein